MPAGYFAHLRPERSNVLDGLRMSLVDRPILPEDFFEQSFIRRSDYAEAGLIKLGKEGARERDESSLANVDEKRRLVTAFGSSLRGHMNDPTGNASPNFPTCDEV
jgi:hypothetical protein